MRQPDFDVVIVGAGVVGSSLARELAGYQLKIGVLEKANDVCYGISSRNTGLLHAGFLYPPGSLKTRLCIEGNKAFDKTAEELDIPVKRTGKLTVGSTDFDRAQFQKLLKRGEENGVTGLEIIEEERLRAFAPAVKGRFALFSATSALINPYLATIAMAENACDNGVSFFFEQPLQKAARQPDGLWELQTPGHRFATRWVINCAGLHAPQVAAMLGASRYNVEYVKGEYIVLDKKAGALVGLPIYPAPDKDMVYDIHVTPTLEGNVLVGPTCDEIVQDTNFDTTRAGLDELLAKGDLLVDGIQKAWQIRSFSGIFPKPRDAATGEELDFQIDMVPELPNVVNLVGITTPGLTSSPAIARHVVEMMQKHETFAKNPHFNPRRKGITPFADMSTDERKAAIEADPNYGEIVCRCESVTRAEILQAMRNSLNRHSVNSIKYRARASMGRCQGGYCETRITTMLQQELGLSRRDICLAGSGSYMFEGEVK